MTIKEKVEDFEQKHPKINIEKAVMIGGTLVLITTIGILAIENKDLKGKISLLMETQGVNGLTDDDLSVIKDMYGDVRELNNAALGIAAKVLDHCPTIDRATAYERTVLEGSRN